MRSDDVGVAFAFAKALASRDYRTAYAMTASEYQRRVTLDEMRAAFEAIVPVDWGAVGSIDVGHTMDDWPGKQASDVGWAYVSIGGDAYSEAITVVVTAEDGSLKVRDVEFGRP
jgi:hypothetical protein